MNKLQAYYDLWEKIFNKIYNLAYKDKTEQETKIIKQWEEYKKLKRQLEEIKQIIKIEKNN